MQENPKKMWSGRFSGESSELLEEFNASIGFDRALWQEDIAGSKAHARMLGACGILKPEESEKIVAGLDAVFEEIKSGKFEFKTADEDIHMAVEKRLSELIGSDLGGRLHTARSRNDQVALDFRLYVLKSGAAIAEKTRELVEALRDIASEHADTLMPGYTHLQHAQPVSLAYHLLAYAFMFRRDYERFASSRERNNLCPLGSAALAGTPHPINRELVARELGFAGVTPNAMDSVSDRDFALEILFNVSVLMTHASRLCEELILWSSQEFGFVTISDAYSTGSSIMPQKKNPDVAELARGKAGRLIGDLTALLAVLKALPLAYDRDLQEDKEPVFDQIDTLDVLCPAVAGMIDTMTIHLERLAQLAPQGFSLATDIAEWLVKRGVPFRDAHEISGACVRLAEARGVELADLTDAELAQASPHLDPEVRSVLTVDGSVRARLGRGGTAPVRVAEQLDEARAGLADAWQWAVAGLR